MNDSTRKSSALAITVGVLAILTGVIHVGLGIGATETAFRWLFILNGLGYIGLTLIYLFPSLLGGNHAVARWALLTFTALTFALYFIMNGGDAFTSYFGLGDKLVELIVIILLIVDILQARKQS